MLIECASRRDEVRWLVSHLRAHSKGSTETLVLVTQPEIYGPMLRAHGEHQGLAVAFSPLAEFTMAQRQKNQQIFILGAARHDIQFLGSKVRKTLVPQLLQDPTVTFLSPQYDLDGQRQVPAVLNESAPPPVINRAELVPKLVLPALSSSASVLSNYASPREVSTTAVGQFASCPYRYFGAYVLRLQEPEVESYWGLSPRKVGEFAHRVFEKEFRAVRAGNPIDRPRLRQIAAEYFPESFKGEFQELEWEQIQRDILKALEAEAAFAGSGTLEPHKEETELFLDFPVTSPHGQVQLRIRCRIDRLDLLRSSGALFVVDYKTRSGSIEPLYREQIMKLIHPQLPIYILAVKQQLKTPVAGGMEVRVRSANRGGVVLKSLAKQFKSTTFAKLDDAGMHLEFERALQEMLGRLLAQDFKPKPRDLKRCGLGKCTYFHLCRYDIQDEEETNEMDHAADN